MKTNSLLLVFIVFSFNYRLCSMFQCQQSQQIFKWGWDTHSFIALLQRRGSLCSLVFYYEETTFFPSYTLCVEDRSEEHEMPLHQRLKHLIQEHSWVMADCCPRQNIAWTSWCFLRTPKYTLYLHHRGFCFPGRQRQTFPFQPLLPAARGHLVAFPCTCDWVCHTSPIPPPSWDVVTPSLQGLHSDLMPQASVEVPAGSGITAPSNTPSSFSLSTRSINSYNLMFKRSHATPGQRHCCEAEISSLTPAIPWHTERLGMEDSFNWESSIHLYLTASIDFQFHICWTVATGHIKIHHHLHCTLQFRLYYHL